MHASARTLFAASCAAILATAACSDSTGVSDTQTAATLTLHFDSIYTAATAAGGAYETRGEVMLYAELPPAAGAVPTSITVSTSAGTEHWKGFEFQVVPTSGGDSGSFVIAYRDKDAHTALVLVYDSTGAIVANALATNDTLVVQSTSQGTGTTARTALSGTCTTILSTLANTQVTSFTSDQCTKAKFTSSVSLAYPAISGVDPALTSLSFTAQTFTGVRFVRASEAGAGARARAKLQALRIARAF